MSLLIHFTKVDQQVMVNSTRTCSQLHTSWLNLNVHDELTNILDPVVDPVDQPSQSQVCQVKSLVWRSTSW